ncbi:coiled-coil domain-containing protein 174-like [Argiope bruennichi]|uniref:Coiled-coil domain-containing protein 174 n=1 Tax=Argiope bruennichi TaxID=94029 RepID=A0A8T0E2S5_ARGBR|nr:coiled-coil domain-containing protein 174-like [Argiope bruennichi]KAF8764559.1 Coiled-coil domain-containing protein 174 [Argiope bruennichi]
MNIGNSNLNPSSMIDLKAELHKKYDSLRKAKLDQRAEAELRSKPTPFKNKLDTNKDKKQKPAPLVKKPKDEESEEDLALKKSQLALEAKAKLYEKIVSNQILIDDEQNELYQVDFQRKVLYDTPKPEKIVENKDMINTNQSDYSASNNTYLQKNLNKSEIQQSRSEKEIPDPDQPIHYQNVQYNEIRDHGTAYFAFSENETKRKEQMEELQSLRQETEAQRITKQKMQNKRKAMIQARLAKICERKNIDQSALEAFKTETPDIPEAQVPDLLSIPLPEPKQENIKKETKVRPWDIGKDSLQHFVPQKKQKTKSQNDWIEEMREERRPEFAPPNLYMSN